MNDKSRGLDLDKLARQLTEAVPQNVKALGEDVERNVKSLLQSGIERMDLVSREEFDLQTAVLERTREKLAALEQARRTRGSAGVRRRESGPSPGAGTSGPHQRGISPAKCARPAVPSRGLAGHDGRR